MKKVLDLMIMFVFCGGCGDNSTGSKQTNPLVGIWEYEGFEDGLSNDSTTLSSVSETILTLLNHLLNNL